MDRHKEIQGFFAAILGTFLFSLKSIFIKCSYAEGAHLEEVLFLRMMFALPFYSVILYRVLITNQNTQKEISIQAIGGMLLAGFLGYYLASYLDFSGLRYISAQLERLTLFTYPAMITVLAALFLKERITRRLLGALCLCYGGLWLLYGQEIQQREFEQEQVLKGFLLVLGSAFSYSVYVIIAKPFIKKYGGPLFTSVAMIGSVGFVFIHVLLSAHFEWSHLLRLPMKIWIYGVILAVFCTVIPSYLLTFSIGRIGASHTSLIGTTGPLFTIALAVAILKEPFTWNHLGALLLICSGVLVLLVKSTSRLSGTGERCVK